MRADLGIPPQFYLPTSYSIANQPSINARFTLIIVAPSSVIRPLDPPLPCPAFSTNTPRIQTTTNRSKPSQNNRHKRRFRTSTHPFDLIDDLMPVFPCCRRCRRCRGFHRAIVRKTRRYSRHCPRFSPIIIPFSSTSPGSRTRSGRARVGRPYRHLFVRAIRDI